MKIKFYRFLIPFIALMIVEESKTQTSLVISDGTVVKIDGGTQSAASFIVLDNSSGSAIQSQGNAYIYSENQYNMLRWIISSETGTYSVPFGTSGEQSLPVEITINQSGSANGSIDFSTYGTGTNNLPLPMGVSSIDHIDIIGDGMPAPPSDGAKVYDRFWFIDASSYTTKPSGFMTVNYASSEQTGDLQAGITSMAVQFHNGNAWLPEQFGIDNMNGIVSGIPFSNDAFYSTFAMVQSGAALPITLTNFNAVWHDELKLKSRVFWSTASELNNDFFDVERSRDGMTWHFLERIDGAGTSIHTNNYEIFDLKPLNGISYYRLKQTDFDGNYSYSQAVSLSRDNGTPSILIYPNPVDNQNHDFFSVYFSDFQNEVVELRIIDNYGRVVHQISTNIFQNPIYQIESNQLQSGAYHIQVSDAEYVITEKLIIKN